MTETFWTNKVWGIEAANFFELIKKLNEFYKDRFVIATQTFQEGKNWRAIVYFKEQPKGDGIEKDGKKPFSDYPKPKREVNSRLRR
jgi:hypothetical protein